MNTNKLISEIKRKRSFLCIGLDVDKSKIPTHLLGFRLSVGLEDVNDLIEDLENAFASL